VAGGVPGRAVTAPVLVVGVPRSGTTWVAQILATAAGGCYLEEPDNHFRFAYAFRAKHQLGTREYPSPAPGSNTGDTSAYDALWQAALTRHPAETRSNVRRTLANALVARASSKRVSAALAGSVLRHPDLAVAARIAVPERAELDGPLVVKSVYAPLAAEWIASNHDVRVVSVLRSPLNVLSSWIELDWLPPSGPDVLSTLDPAIAQELAERYEAPPPARSTLARAAWVTGALTCALDEATRRNPAWARVVHEELCVAPGEEYPRVAERVGLRWTAEGDSALEAGNRPGRGYETARVAADTREAWRDRLDDAQVTEIRRVLERLPLALDM
jgi:Sulfotransferase family